MGSKRKVTNVDRYMDGGALWWKVTYEVSEADPGEGPVHYFLFPHEALEWRMAEYDLDVTDVDSALDIVLSEPFLSPLQPPPLFTSATIEEARQVHVAQCAEVKLGIRLSSRGIQNPLEMVRSEFSVRTEEIKAKKEGVRRIRREKGMNGTNGNGTKGKNRG